MITKDDIKIIEGQGFTRGFLIIEKLELYASEVLNTTAIDIHDVMTERAKEAIIDKVYGDLKSDICELINIASQVSSVHPSTVQDIGDRLLKACNGEK